MENKLIRCQECEKLVKRESNKQQYCKECASKIEKEKTRLRVEKHRKILNVTV